MRKILLAALGIGYGHAVRMHSIANLLKKKVEFEILASGVAYDYLKDQGFSPIKIDSHTFREDKEFVFNTFSTIVKNLDFPFQMTRNYFKISSIIDNFKPDLLLCDTEPTSFLTAMNKRVKIHTITNLPLTIDESKRINVTGDMKNQLLAINKLVNIILKNSEVTYVPSFIKPRYYLRSVRYIGSILRDENVKIEDKNYFLITLGGSMFGNHILKALMRILPKFKDHKFIIATNNRYKSSTKSDNLTLMPFVSEKYFKKAKGIITLGGYNTLCESVSYKKPVFMIPITDHVEQFMNAHMMKRHNFGEYAYFKKKIDEKTLEEKLRAFFDNYSLYKEKLDNFNAKTNGAEEIVNSII